MAEGGVIIRDLPNGEWRWVPEIPTGTSTGGSGGTGTGNKIWCKWGQTNWTYNESPYKWKQSCITVGLAIEILRHTGGPEPDARLGDWLEKHPDKKKRLIELLCLIDGKKYTQKKYINENAKITVKDVKIFAQHVLGENIFKVDGEVITGKKKDITVTVKFD